jgi:hypothetical protein
MVLLAGLAHQPCRIGRQPGVVHSPLGRAGYCWIVKTLELQKLERRADVTLSERESRFLCSACRKCGSEARPISIGIKVRWQ